MRRFTAAAAAALLACSALDAQVELRRGEPPPPGRIVDVDDQGVTIRHEPEGGAPTEAIVSWDRVKVVTGEHADEAAALADTADRLWRARARIERDDWRLGEPLFERLFADYGTLTGPTSALVAEGLLRARLRRGAQAAAVRPWLSLVRIHRRHASGAAAPTPPGAPDGARTPIPRTWIGGHIELAPIVDPATSLAPALPPIWLSGPAVDTLADSPDLASSAVGDVVAEDMAALYRLAAAFEAGRDATMSIEPLSAHPGVTLVREVVAARIGDVEERWAARDTLLRRLDAEPASWIRVWCHAGIGRSLLRESEDALRRRGVLHLLHIPASYGPEHPYLAGVALAEAAVAMADMGDHASAASLRAELERNFSDHPALAWPPLRRAASPDHGPVEEPEPETPPDPKGAA